MKCEAALTDFDRWLIFRGLSEEGIAKLDTGIRARSREISAISGTVLVSLMMRRVTTVLCRGCVNAGEKREQHIYLYAHGFISFHFHTVYMCNLTC